MTSWGNLFYETVLEASLFSAVLWVIVELATRTFRVSEPSWRVRFFMLPLLLPALMVPLVHLGIRPVFPGFALTPLEDLLVNLLHMAHLWPELLLAVGIALLVLGSIPGFCTLGTVFMLRKDWRARQESDTWFRCNGMLQCMASRLQMPAPRLILSERSQSGCLALGALGSYIVLSRELVSALDDEEVDALLAHEMAHIKRKDSALGIAAAVCHGLLAMSPFSHWAYSSLMRAREHAADDLSVRWCGRPFALASCLVKACQVSQKQKRYALSSGLVTSQATLESRITRLIGERNDAASRTHFWAFTGVSSVAVIAFLITF